MPNHSLKGLLLSVVAVTPAARDADVVDSRSGECSCVTVALISESVDIDCRGEDCLIGLNPTAAADWSVLMEFSAALAAAELSGPAAACEAGACFTVLLGRRIGLEPLADALARREAFNFAYGDTNTVFGAAAAAPLGLGTAAAADVGTMARPGN